MMRNKGDDNSDYRIHYNHVLIDTSHFFDFIPYTQVQSFAILFIFIYIIYFCILFVETKLSCSMCKKSFSHPKTLKLHMRLHNSSKGYECSICHKRFTSMFLLLTSKNLVLNVSFSECHIDVFCCRERKPQSSHENSQRIQDYTISGINKPIIQLFGIYCILLLILQKIIPYP